VRAHPDLMGLLGQSTESDRADHQNLATFQNLASRTAGNADARSTLLEGFEGFTGAVNGPGSAAPFVWMWGSLKMSEIRPRRSVGLSRTVDGLRSPPVSGPRDFSRAHAILRLVLKPSFSPSSSPIGSSRVVSSSKEPMRSVSSSLWC
jgi:hypothetical protein